jgi:hypothetical protein
MQLPHLRAAHDHRDSLSVFIFRLHSSFFVHIKFVRLKARHCWRQPLAQLCT